MPSCDPKVNAIKLHIAMSSLLETHKRLIHVTNSEPLFGEPEAVIAAGRALYEFMPMADWEEDAKQYDAEMAE